MLQINKLSYLEMNLSHLASFIERTLFTKK